MKEQKGDDTILERGRKIRREGLEYEEFGGLEGYIWVGM